MLKRIAVVIGANKGLGRALVRGMCRELGSDVTVVLTARDEGRGREAIATLRAEGLTPALGLVDLAEPASITTLAERLGREHDGVDILIQNGAYAALPDVPPATQARVMIKTNNLGTTRVLEAFKPLLRPNARVLVVASAFGVLKNLPAHLRDRFDTERLSLAELDRNLLAYVEAVEQGRAVAEGWPNWINVPSKIGQVAAMRIFARDWARAPRVPGVLINAACPGWMITDASRPYLTGLPAGIVAKAPEDAEPDVRWAVTLPDGATAPYSELLQFRKPIPWNES